MDDGDFEELVNCVALPIRSSVGVVGAFSVTALRVVQDLDQLKARIPQIQKRSNSIPESSADHVVPPCTRRVVLIE